MKAKQILELAYKGYSVDLISLKLNCTLAYVKKVCRDNGYII